MEKVQSDEIDLLELVASFLAALKRNLLLTIILPLAGILIALAISYNSRDVFESSLLIETSLLTENECNFLFEQLDKFGVIPGLTKEQDDQVAGFKFKVTRHDGPVLSDVNMYQLNNRVYIEVTARVFDKTVFVPLEKALVKFIDGSASVVRNRNEREKFYSEMIKRIDEEIASMDKVKEVISTKTQATYLNPSELYANSVKLYEDKTAYSIRLQEIRSVHLIKGFDSLSINAQLSKMIIALIGFAVGFCVLLMLLFIQFFRRYYKSYETTH